MNAALDPQAWVARAEEDYEMARVVLRRKKPLTDSSCFHAQQCAEKYLKAMLVAHETKFPKTHDLILLNNLCVQAGIFVEIDLEQLHTLSDDAVRSRYPGEHPTAEEAREAMKTAQAVRKFARKFLSG